MTRLYNIILILLASATFTACESGSAEDRDPSKLGRVIWHEAQKDITFVNEALIEIVNFNYILTAESTEEQEQRLKHFYGENSELKTSNQKSFKVNIYTSDGTLKRYTEYETNGHNLGQGEWNIKRVSGDSYKIAITTNGNTLKAKFTSLSYAESKGSAEIAFTFSYEDTQLNISGYPEAHILYTGWIEMVDGYESSKSPVTLKCETTSECKYSFYNKFSESSYRITCHDALYNATDEIKVYIDVNPKIVTIECYDTTNTYTL